MNRKALLPIIAIGALLLVFIAGGAAVMIVKVRNNAVPTFSEVDRQLRDLPADTGWTFVRRDQETPIVVRWHGWWDRLGMSRARELEQTAYLLSHQASTGRGKIVISHEKEKIEAIGISGSFQEQSDELMKTFQRQFPKLPAYLLPPRKTPSAAP